MQYMFSYCRSLESLPDISRWNINNLQNVRQIFFDCRSLTSLPDKTNWNINDDCNIENMFENWALLEISEKINKKFKVIHCDLLNINNNS